MLGTTSTAADVVGNLHTLTDPDVALTAGHTMRAVIRIITAVHPTAATVLLTTTDDGHVAYLATENAQGTELSEPITRDGSQPWTDLVVDLVDQLRAFQLDGLPLTHAGEVWRLPLRPRT